MTNTLQWGRSRQDGLIFKRPPDSGGGIFGLARKVWGASFQKYQITDEQSVPSRFPR